MDGLEKAMLDLKEGRAIPPFECHRKVSSLYNWHDVTQRTEVVYDIVARDKSKALGSLLQWLVPFEVIPWIVPCCLSFNASMLYFSYINAGVLPFMLVVALCHLLLRALEWIVPSKVINGASLF